MVIIIVVNLLAFANDDLHSFSLEKTIRMNTRRSSKDLVRKNEFEKQKIESINTIGYSFRVPYSKPEETVLYGSCPKLYKNGF